MRTEREGREVTIQQRRERLGMTPREAAARAGVSRATWNKFEADPTAVRPSTAKRCELALAPATPLSRGWGQEERALMSSVAESWADGPLTPRQAYALMTVLGEWADTELQPWLEGEVGHLAHQVNRHLTGGEERTAATRSRAETETAPRPIGQGATLCRRFLPGDPKALLALERATARKHFRRTTPGSCCPGRHSARRSRAL
jgi:DNA-binding XRE family transcriptional regulator